MESFLRGRLAEETFAPTPTFRPSLTISRQCGAGTDRIGQALVEYLDNVDESAVHGWALFDQSLLGKIISDHRLPPSLVEPYLAERAKFPVVDALEQVLKLHPSQWTLFNHSAATIRTLCGLGNSVVLGRAGNFVTSDLANTFHVRLVGSERKRINYTRHRFQLTDDDAEKLVRKIDRTRTAFVRRYTGADVNDSNAYHLVINTDNLSDEVIVRIVGDSLVEWAHEKGTAKNVS